MSTETRTCWSTLQERISEAKAAGASISEKRRIARLFAAQRQKADARYLDPESLTPVGQLGLNIVRSTAFTEFVLAPAMDLVGNRVNLAALPEKFEFLENVLFNQAEGEMRNGERRGRSRHGSENGNDCCFTVATPPRPQVPQGI